MRLGLISQIKNEIDIIVPFLEHIDSLFDCVYLLDHQSIDDTTYLLKQAVSQRNSWKYYYLDFMGQYQKRISNFFLPMIFRENIDYLFFLDADEFINVENRKMLEANLSGLKSNSKVGRLQWINTSPIAFEQSNFSYSTPLLKSPNQSSYGKVVIPKIVFLNDPKLTVELGNHHIRNKNREIIHESYIGEIIHIPIRSKDQAIKKAIATGITKAAKNVPVTGNYKYAECLNMIANGKLNQQGLIKLVHIYETPKSRYDQQDFLDAYWMKAEETSFEQLRLSKSKALILNKPENNPPLHEIIADLLVKQSENYPLNFKFILDNEIVKIVMHDEHMVPEPGENNKFISIYNSQKRAFNQSKEDALNLTQRKIKKKNRLINELRKELKTTHGEVNFYKNSKSWKLTKPLRAMMNLIRRIGSN